jgi:hypothetical protein
MLKELRATSLEWAMPRFRGIQKMQGSSVVIHDPKAHLPPRNSNCEHYRAGFFIGTNVTVPLLLELQPGVLEVEISSDAMKLNIVRDNHPMGGGYINMTASMTGRVVHEICNFSWHTFSKNREFIYEVAIEPIARVVEHYAMRNDQLPKSVHNLG